MGTTDDLDPLEGMAPLDGMPDPAPDDAPARPRSRTRTRRPASDKPKRERTPRPPGSAAPRSSSRKPPLGPRVAQAHLLLGMGASFAPIPNAQAIGTALALHADQIGASWEQLAKENPRVREMLERVLTAGAVGQVVMAYVPVLLAASGRMDVLAGLASMADAAQPTPPADAPAGPVPGPSAAVA